MMNSEAEAMDWFKAYVHGWNPTKNAKIGWWILFQWIGLVGKIWTGFTIDFPIKIMGLKPGSNYPWNQSIGWSMEKMGKICSNTAEID